MSRGSGPIELGVIRVLEKSAGANGMTPEEVAWFMTKRPERPETTRTAFHASVRRALRRLLDKRIVTEVQPHRYSLPAWERQFRAQREASERYQRRRAREAQRRHERVFPGFGALYGTAAEPSREEQTLIKLLGMLGSEHDGEVLNAARQIERKRRQMGKTWEELLVPD